MAIHRGGPYKEALIWIVFRSHIRQRNSLATGLDACATIIIVATTAKIPDHHSRTSEERKNDKMKKGKCSLRRRSQ